MIPIWETFPSLEYDRTLGTPCHLLRDENDQALLFAPANVRPARIYRNIFGQMQFHGNGVGLVCDLIETTSRNIAAPPRDLERFRVYVRAWCAAVLRDAARRRAHE